MSVNCKSSFVRVAAAVAVALPVLSTAARAGVIWDGGHASSNSWGSNTNWDADTLPTFGSTTDLTFGATSFARPSSFIAAARNIRSLTFNSNVSAPVFIGFHGFPSGPQVAYALTMGGSGSATITVDSGVAHAITLANSATGTLGTNGTLTLADNLVVNHNGSATLSVVRQVAGATFGVTKNGPGTLQLSAGSTATGALNLNQGKLIVSAFSAATDLDSYSAVNLGAGLGVVTLEVNANFNNKTFALAPINVNSAANLDYNNTDLPNNYNLTFSGANAFALNADLTIRNISASPTNNNAINISRNVTGTGDIIVSTGNNLTSNSGNFSYQRPQLSGTNSGWSGDLVIAKGSAQLSGNAAQGTGAITIGTTGDAFGAGLAFNQTSDVALSRNITVATGGFRGIKINNFPTGDTTLVNVTGYNVVMSGNVALDGTLSVDHSLISTTTFSPATITSHSMTISGNISGNGGLNVTRVHTSSGNNPSSSRSRLVLTGVNTYTGPTSVSSTASLIVDGSLTSDITVSGGRFGGNGSTTGSLTMAAGSTFVFSPTDTVDVDGVVTLDSTFGVASLVNVDGTAIDWTAVSTGTYTLIGSTTSTFNHISNFGLANAATVGDKLAYFQNGSLQLVVTPVPEPTTLAMFVALGSFVTLRRRRD